MVRLEESMGLNAKLELGPSIKSIAEEDGGQVLREPSNEEAKRQLHHTKLDRIKTTFTQ